MFRPTSPKHLLRPALLALLAAGSLAACDQPKSQSNASAPKPAETATPAADAAKPGDPKDPVLAIVNGTPIKGVDVMAMFGQQAQQMPYPQLIDQAVSFTLLTQAGRADKLADDPEVKAQLARALDSIIARAYISKVARAAATDEATKALYDAKVAKGEIGEEVKARHILVKTEPEAKAIIVLLDKGGDFGKLATDKSTDKGAQNGELGWFTKDKMVPEFSDAAFALKKGEYTKTPVKTQFGYHVIQVEDRRSQTYDDEKQALQTEISRKAIADKVAELKAGAKIEEFNPDGTPLNKEPPAPPADAPATPPTPATPAPDTTKK